jgi:hypothetical protein
MGQNGLLPRWNPSLNVDAARAPELASAAAGVSVPR